MKLEVQIEGQMFELMVLFDVDYLIGMNFNSYDCEFVMEDLFVLIVGIMVIYNKVVYIGVFVLYRMFFQFLEFNVEWNNVVFFIILYMYFQFLECIVEWNNELSNIYNLGYQLG